MTKYLLSKKDYTLIDTLIDSTSRRTTDKVLLVDASDLSFPLEWYSREDPWIKRTSITTFDLLPGIYYGNLHTKITNTIDAAGNTVLTLKRYKAESISINSIPEKPTEGLTVARIDDYTKTILPETLVDTYNETNVSITLNGTEYLVAFVNGISTLPIGIFGKTFFNTEMSITITGNSYTETILYVLTIANVNKVISYVRANRPNYFIITDWMVIRHQSQLAAGTPTTLTTTQYQELLAYAQALRDFPTTVDTNVGSLEEVIWPTKPGFM